MYSGCNNNTNDRNNNNNKRQSNSVYLLWRDFHLLLKFFIFVYKCVHVCVCGWPGNPFRVLHTYNIVCTYLKQPMFVFHFIAVVDVKGSFIAIELVAHTRAPASVGPKKRSVWFVCN
ncbi:unnamed protein product [Ceratitis capitata]|uniref:(Mediterranean fruit fly) hypothetical protein n=1 Tax=Ceratitis capitata TaxID=7213 RepID=A0A811UZQ3_CERCA|nr:unnamed protein product [Ceratitis capitata]